jgi:membrane-associated phospholipid phosphatase
MLNLRILSMLGAGLLAASPVLGQAPAESVDAPSQLPLLVWEDATGAATAPWRCSSDDWTQVAIGAGAVLGTALLLDRPIQRSLQRHDSSSLHHLADHIAPIGNEYSFIVAAGFYAAGYLNHDSEAQAAGADAFSSLLVATVALVPLKYGFGRATPNDGLGSDSFKPLSSRDSFPSGHTTWAFTAAAAFTEHYSEPWVQVTAYGLAGLVGLARLEQNQHWTSDVVAGALLGTTIGKVVTRLNQHKRFGQHDQVRFSLEPELGMGYQGIRMALKF